MSIVLFGILSFLCSCAMVVWYFGGRNPKTKGLKYLMYKCQIMPTVQCSILQIYFTFLKLLNHYSNGPLIMKELHKTHVNYKFNGFNGKSVQ